MKKYFKARQPVLLLLVGIAIFSCKKDNNTPDKVKTRLLTEKTWKQVKIERRTNPADPWSDITSSYHACDLDNITTFKQSGTYTETEGATKCVSVDPDEVLNGFWSFRNGGTVLRMSVALLLGVTDDAVIETLNESSLVLSYAYSSPDLYLRVTMEH